MTKLTNILIGSLILVSVIMLVVVCVVKQNIIVQPTPVNINAPVSEPVLGSIADITRIGDGVTAVLVSISTTTVATGTNTVAFSSDSGVRYRRIQNTGATGITCQLDNATSTLAYGTGIVMASSTASITNVYEIGPNNLYWGMVRCIADTSTGTISTVKW